MEVALFSYPHWNLQVVACRDLDLVGHLGKISRGPGARRREAARGRGAVDAWSALADRHAKLRGSEAAVVATPATAPGSGAGTVTSWLCGLPAPEAAA